jgi:hypothetical protein
MSRINFNLFIILISLFALTQAVMDKEKIVFAVNCGGEEYEDSNGINFVKVIFKIKNSLLLKINNIGYRLLQRRYLKRLWSPIRYQTN